MLILTALVIYIEFLFFSKKIYCKIISAQKDFPTFYYVPINILFLKILLKCDFFAMKCGHDAL